jgi:hypothetical protein
MVAIKDFGMPSCCENCNINKFDYLGSQGTAHWNCAITENECEDYENKRNSDCPLVETEERKIGKWIEVWESQRDEFSGEYDEWREHKCSICDFQEMDADRFNFCPNCGADMRGNENV